MYNRHSAYIHFIIGGDRRELTAASLCGGGRTHGIDFPRGKKPLYGAAEFK